LLQTVLAEDGFSEYYKTSFFLVIIYYRVYTHEIHGFMLPGH